jgi:D-3-phosphoglycerate dehydrogenase
LAAYTGFPLSRQLLRERLADGPIRLVEMDPGHPLEAQVGSVEALIPSMTPIAAALMDAAPRLRLIVQFGAGLEGVDQEAARARGIAVRNAPGLNAEAVAEHVAFLMLALARRLPEHARSFASRVIGSPPGRELAGKTLGIVGLGASGRALARLARAFGMRVIAVRRSPGASDPDAEWLGGPGDLDALLARSDVVSLLAPLDQSTRGLIDARRLALMKPSAFLINAGRGGLVDRAALVEALASRRIAGAGLDVFWDEPPDPADPLLAMDNLVATPHVAGVTVEALGRIADRVVEMLREHLGPAEGPTA